MNDLNVDAYLNVNAISAHTGWLHDVASTYAVYGVILFAAALVAAALRSRRQGPEVAAATFWAGAGTLLALALNQPLGQLFHVARPYATHPDAVLLVGRASDYAFPSDHSVMAGAVATGLLIAWRRLGVVVAIAAVVLAADRVYVGAHYPADVAAGLLFGSLVVALGWLGVSRPLTALSARLRTTALRPLLVASTTAEGVHQ